MNPPADGNATIAALEADTILEDGYRHSGSKSGKAKYKPTRKPTRKPTHNPITSNPTSSPTASNPSQSPTAEPSRNTNAPTYIPPPGTIYFTSFEANVNFPQDAQYEQWGAFAGYPSITAMDGYDQQPELWFRSETMPRTGNFSLMSPDLHNANLSPAFSSVTFSTKADYPEGDFNFFVNADIDDDWYNLTYSVDGGMMVEIGDTNAQYSGFNVSLPGGKHVIEIRYTFNPNDLTSLPATNKTGHVFIDDVSYSDYSTVPASLSMSDYFYLLMFS